MERLRTGIKPHPFSAFTISPVHLRPEGRGWVRIKSPDPLAPPAIQFNFLASDYDFQALIYGTRLSRKIAAQPALKPFVVEEVIPGASCRERRQMIEEIRVRGVSNLHPVGTCRMGREVDAVVDPRLRVHGIAGAARRRRLDHAAGARRQHQRAVDHDRRKMRRDDPRGRAGGLADRARGNARHDMSAVRCFEARSEEGRWRYCRTRSCW